ncbi:DNA-processing protein DprA [Rubrobacter indicoceani]|uniref:DNA-processing protein DprA n=1 Tax=Rubrobacter indicoceani TaxID=2051957 RepID=UPI000E5AE011|nr:DNA-processing protein DprA [Rubrobacter indicoceani]
MSRSRDISGEREACLFFSLVQAQVGRSLSNRLGGRSLVEAASLSVPELSALANLSEKAAATLGRISSGFDAGAMLEELNRNGVRAVTLADGEYPERLRGASDPPPALFVRGEFPPGREGIGAAAVVAVVGSRKASVGAHSVARSLGRLLAERGVSVVSGLALGIDAAAHRGALDAGGETVGVLGCGIDVVYPKRNGRLFEEIVSEGGAVVSEYYLGEAPLAWRFPARNRIIAALSDATVVVEAAERSGSLITARHALDEGREVWAVPGPVGMDECRGSNKLLSDGAAVLWDVREFASSFGEAPAPVEKEEPAVPEGLPDREAKALGAVDFAPSAVDTVALRSGMQVRDLLPVLTMLELKGYVSRDATGAFARKARGS